MAHPLRDPTTYNGLPFPKLRNPNDLQDPMHPWYTPVKARLRQEAQFALCPWDWDMVPHLARVHPVIAKQIDDEIYKVLWPDYLDDLDDHGDRIHDRTELLFGSSEYHRRNLEAAAQKKQAHQRAHEYAKANGSYWNRFTANSVDHVLANAFFLFFIGIAMFFHSLIDGCKAAVRTTLKFFAEAGKTASLNTVLVALLIGGSFFATQQFWGVYQETKSTQAHLATVARSLSEIQSSSQALGSALVSSQAQAENFKTVVLNQQETLGQLSGRLADLAATQQAAQIRFKQEMDAANARTQELIRKSITPSHVLPSASGFQPQPSKK